MPSHTRIAIVDENKCKPEKCKKECIKSCPPQKNGFKVIDIEDVVSISNQSNQSNQSKQNIIDKSKITAKINEELCIGCNICVDRCPFSAIKIVNLPSQDPNEIIHRYSKNGFRFYKLPYNETRKSDWNHW